MAATNSLKQLNNYLGVVGPVMDDKRKVRYIEDKVVTDTVMKSITYIYLLPGTGNLPHLARHSFLRLYGEGLLKNFGNKTLKRFQALEHLEEDKRKHFLI